MIRPSIPCAGVLAVWLPVLFFCWMSGLSPFSTAQARGLGESSSARQDDEDSGPVAKDFYSPGDDFPGNPQGYKIIGKFRVSAFSNGGYYLQADSSRGEKDVMRRFVPRNDSIQPDATYTFTRERPMVIVSKSLLGQYDVDLPDNLFTDQAAEQQARMVAHQEEVARQQREREERERLAKIPAFARPMVERQKSKNTSAPVAVSFPKLGGFGKLAWGSDLETTILHSEIDPGMVTDVAEFHRDYARPGLLPQQRLQLHQQHLEWIDKINKTTACQLAGMRAVPDLGAVFGQQGRNTVVCLLQDGGLYAVGFFYPSGIMGEPVKTLVEALKMKYGNCSIETRKIDGRPWTAMKWSNENGTVVLVLKPFQDFEMELRKMLLPAARAEMASKTAELQMYGQNAFTDSIQQLSDATMDAFQAMVNAYDNQIELGGLFYYSHSVVARAPEKERALQSAITQDQQAQDQEEVRRRQQAASQLLDKI